MITKRWVTMKEACTYLSVSPSTIERWVAEGRLTKHRVEGHRAVRFSLKELGSLLTPTFDDAAGPDRCMVCGGPLLSPLQRKHWECFEHLEILPPWDDQAPPEQTGGRCPC